MIGHNGIGEAIDRKFKIDATAREHGTDYDENHAVLFLAKDRALFGTLGYYRSECERLGAAPDQLRGIDLLIQRVERYQSVNANLVKTPDVDPVTGAHILEENRQERGE